MSIRIAETPCLDLAGCVAHGLSADAARDIAAWHREAGVNGPAARRNRHRAVAQHFDSVAHRLGAAH